MKTLTHKLIWLTFFSIAMGYLETAVVVYLRKIYYPGGFNFPLVPIDTQIAAVEFWREAATLIMLLGVAVLTGKTRAQRLAYFVYCFAVWDLFYYVFLKIILDWPSSFLTWDILFLIPVPWVGPVIAPCIISLTMIALTLTIVYHENKGVEVMLNWKERTLLITGSLVVILSFVWDYLSYISSNHDAAWTLSDQRPMFDEIGHYIPQKFNWYIFLTGELILLAAILFLIKRVGNQHDQK